MGRTYWEAQTMNCHALETGNIELLPKYCNEEQKKKWLQPLLEGTASSAYSITEPDVASSDATRIACSITQDGDEYVINGQKLYGNVSTNPDLTFYILMGCTDPTNPDPWKCHSTIIAWTRLLKAAASTSTTTAAYQRKTSFLEGAVPSRSLKAALGRQDTPLYGQCERAYELALIRCTSEQKKPHGRLIGGFDSNIERLAIMRLQIDSMGLIVLNAADTVDQLGNKAGKYAIAQSKILVPKMAAEIIGECMQMYGGQGLTQHTPLPEMWTYARFVRVAGGRDAAHRHHVGRDQLKRVGQMKSKHNGYEKRSIEIAKAWALCRMVSAS